LLSLFYYSFLYYGPENVGQPRATAEISCDAPKSKSYLNSDDDIIFSLCPAPLKDQHTDFSLKSLSNTGVQAPLFEYKFQGVPESQHMGRRPLMSSQASADSQGSSGYYSENSSLSDSRNDSFLSNNIRTLYPRGTCKRLKCNEKKYRGSRSSTSTSNSSTSNNNSNSSCSSNGSTEADKHSSASKHLKCHSTSTNSCANGYQNCFTHSTSTNNYENASALNAFDAPPLPPRPIKKKTPIYENNRDTLFPISPSSKHHRRQRDNLAQCLTCELPLHIPETPNSCRSVDKNLRI